MKKLSCSIKEFEWNSEKKKGTVTRKSKKKKREKSIDNMP